MVTYSWVGNLHHWWIVDPHEIHRDSFFQLEVAGWDFAKNKKWVSHHYSKRQHQKTIISLQIYLSGCQTILRITWISWRFRGIYSWKCPMMCLIHTIGMAYSWPREEPKKLELELCSWMRVGSIWVALHDGKQLKFCPYLPHPLTCPHLPHPFNLELET